jgi:cytochrome c oxidase subunit 2
MNFLVLFLILLLIIIIVIQLGKVRNLSSVIRGEEKVARQNNDRTAMSLLIFNIVFLVFCVVSALYYKNSMLGYGPHGAASLHGGSIDTLFNTTLFFTGIVFVLTHIALFWYTWKYRERDNAQVNYFVHSTKLELVWTMIPAVVMAFLVVQGLMVWNDVMPDVGPEDQYLEIGATGEQFQWHIRYPGPDGILGEKNFRKIDMAVNPLGLDCEDDNVHDDIVIDGPFLVPVNQMVRVSISAKDVLHNFYLPHFRVKMDAIPGLPTYFIFTPIKTTEEYRQELKNYPEWQVPADPEEPDGPQRWEAFEYELACAELCGKGHYSMRRILRVVSEEEYAEWAAGLESTYMSSIRGTDADCRKGELLKVERDMRSKELMSSFSNALTDEDASGVITLEHVFFKTGSADLDDKSFYELDNLADLLKANGNVQVELGGHTDSTGDAGANEALSLARAEACRAYLASKGARNTTAKGYGQGSPRETNDTAEGRALNRRTELKILSK